MIRTGHGLALFLFVGVPVWDQLETRGLKAGTNPRLQTLTQRRIAAIEWTAALLAWIVLLSGFPALARRPSHPPRKA
jgi:hypothetical protein